MPWFMSKDGSERIWFSQMPEPCNIAGVKFNGGDYACVEENNTVKALTEEVFLEMTQDMKKMDWL
jgi:hypothetical protein